MYLHVLQQMILYTMYGILEEVSIVLGSGLSHNGTKPLPAPM